MNRSIGSSISIRTGRRRYISVKSLRLVSISSHLERTAQLRVFCRSRHARCDRSRGAYVSGTNGNVSRAMARDAIAVRFAILQQLRQHSSGGYLSPAYTPSPAERAVHERRADQGTKDWSNSQKASDGWHCEASLLRRPYIRQYP